MQKKKAIIVTNRQALRDFYIDKTYESGLKLEGSEVKSIRNKKVNFKGSFARFENNELFVYNVHINPYEYSREDYNPTRPRKLLLHRKELEDLAVGVEQKGYTIVPLSIYFRRKHAKLEIALARGKKLYDKRRSLKEKEAKREIDRTLRQRNK